MTRQSCRDVHQPAHLVLHIHRTCRPICSTGRRCRRPLGVCLAAPGARRVEGRCQSRTCSVSGIRIAAALGTVAIGVAACAAWLAGVPAVVHGLPGWPRTSIDTAVLAGAGEPGPARHHHPRRPASRQGAGRPDRDPGRRDDRRLLLQLAVVQRPRRVPVRRRSVWRCIASPWACSGPCSSGCSASSSLPSPRSRSWDTCPP